MVSVTLRKLDGNGTTVFTMDLRNMQSWTTDLNFPIVATPLPQEDASEQILLKLMGNNSVTKFSWQMKDEVTQVVTEVAATQTLPEQFDFWRSSMRPVSIEDGYELEIGFATPMIFVGSISNVKINMSGQAPVSALASFNFMEGSVNGGIYELDAPSPPRSVTTTSFSAGQLQYDWLAAENPGSAAVDIWKIQWRLQGASTWSQNTEDDLIFTHLKTGLATGTYETRVLGANIYGDGQPSPILTVAVA